jgi:hypothetical protein
MVVCKRGQAMTAIWHFRMIRMGVLIHYYILILLINTNEK